MSERPSYVEVPCEAAAMRRGFAWVLGAVIAVTLLKTLRPPNLYAASHFVFNYSCGFVRRGLVGEVMQRLLGAPAFTYEAFVVFAFTLFTLATAGLAFSARRVLAASPSDLGLRCALLVFCSSPALAFFVHIIGYLDYIGLLAVLGVLAWAPSSRSQYALFYVITPCAVAFAFIHEILAVMFMPTFCVLMVCHMLRHWPSQTRWQRVSMFSHAATVVLLAFVLSGVVSTQGTRDPATINKLFHTLAAKVDFGLRSDAFSALSRSSADNVASLMPSFWRHNPLAGLAPKGWLAAAPSLLFLLGYALCLVREVPFAAWGRWFLGLAIFAAFTAPHTLNLVGWDWNRWNAISLLACFGCILSVRLYFPSVRSGRGASAPWLTAGVVACVLSLSADTPLFDDLKIQFFPFEGQWEFVRSLFESGFRYRPRY